MSAGGKVHFLHRVGKEPGTFFVQLAVLADLPRTHRRIGEMRCFSKPVSLSLPRGDDSFADGGGCFTGESLRGKLAEIDQRNFDV